MQFNTFYFVQFNFKKKKQYKQNQFNLKSYRYYHISVYTYLMIGLASHGNSCHVCITVFI